MIIDFETLPSSQIYHTLIQTVIPRPIAWVLSINEDQSYNLAPYSFFTAVSSSPAVIMFVAGKKPWGEEKDSRVNAEQRKQFVIHISHQGQLEAVNESSRDLPAGESELDNVDLALTDFDGFAVPRLADCPVAYACECFRVDQITEAHAAVYARVTKVYIDDKAASEVNGRLKVDAKALDPLSRLGGDDYAALGQFSSIKRPKYTPQ